MDEITKGEAFTLHSEDLTGWDSLTDTGKRCQLHVAHIPGGSLYRSSFQQTDRSGRVMVCSESMVFVPAHIPDITDEEREALREEGRQEMKRRLGADGPLFSSERYNSPYGGPV